MPFDESTWKFPSAKLIPKHSVLCLFKSDDGQVECGGARIECETIPLPDINESYEKDSDEAPEIMLNFGFPFSSLTAITGKTFSLGEDVEDCGDELGTVYLFGAHNPVGWESIEFGKTEADTIEAVVDLYFDFEFEGRIGGKFRHKIPVIFELERRWKL